MHIAFPHIQTFLVGRECFREWDGESEETELDLIKHGKVQGEDSGPSRASHWNISRKHSGERRQEYFVPTLCCEEASAIWSLHLWSLLHCPPDSQLPAILTDFSLDLPHALATLSGPSLLPCQIISHKWQRAGLGSFCWAQESAFCPQQAWALLSRRLTHPAPSSTSTLEVIL